MDAQCLYDYVNSGASTFLTSTNSSPNHELVKRLNEMLDPSTLQLCKLTLMRANQQLIGLEEDQKMTIFR